VSLTVITDSGCVSMATQVIEIAAETMVYMPNAFSPDGDGTNEVLRAELQGIAPDHFDLMIFDRWGQILFSTTDGLIGWDGTFHNGGVQVPAGVYVWKLTARSAYSGERIERSGHVVLLR
jgi:gliding motility-associated-like protein